MDTLQNQAKPKPWREDVWLNGNGSLWRLRVWSWMNPAIALIVGKILRLRVWRPIRPSHFAQIASRTADATTPYAD